MCVKPSSFRLLKWSSAFLLLLSAIFQIGEYTFEVGGKKKGKKQLAEATRGIVVRDDIEYYSPDIVPLFAFGLLYWRSQGGG